MKQKKNININILIFLLLILIGCKNKKQENKEKMQQYAEYKDLYEHQGTENYEVIKLLDKKTIINELLLDKKQKLLSITNKDRLKVNCFGEIVGKGLTSKTLKDGTMYGYDSYLNWFVNDDETIYKYIDPFTGEKVDDIYKFKQPETNYKKWLIKFKELYNKATYIHRDGAEYYLKVENQWFYMYGDHHKDKNRPKDFVKQYPEKISPNEIRMVNIPEISDRILGKQLKIVKYIEQDKREGRGLNPINFSSGYYMFELHLPKGDVLKFRRYGAVGFSADLNIYQIPEEFGGSNEVYFIEQKPREMYPNKSFAGFYAIRPKKYRELPEYKHYLEKEKQEDFKNCRSFIDNE